MIDSVVRSNYELINKRKGDFMLKIRGSLLMLLIVIMLFAIIPFSKAGAHSVLENATPADGEQLNEPINRIELSFNTKVENGSTLTLVKDTGDEIKPSSIEITGNALEAIFEDSLEPGSYQVNWKIIGADGHLIENQYSFTIKESEITQDEDNATQSEDEQTNSTSEKENLQNEEGKENGVKNQDLEKQNQQTSNENEQSSLGSVIIILLIIVGLGLLAWMLFSKRK